jgi:hypothetical protein
MRTTFKYEIWSKGESFDKQPEATLKFTCYSLQECADMLGVKVSTIRNILRSGFHYDWQFYHTLYGTTYQIKRLLNT